jgi:hypothetical protein
MSKNNAPETRLPETLNLTSKLELKIFTFINWHSRRRMLYSVFLKSVCILKIRFGVWIFRPFDDIIFHYGIVLTLRGHLYIVLAKMKVWGQNCPVQVVHDTNWDLKKTLFVKNMFFTTLSTQSTRQLGLTSSEKYELSFELGKNCYIFMLKIS